MADALSPGMPKTGAHSARRLAGAVMALMVVVFCVAVAQTADPARSSAVLHPTDGRWRHIGSLSFAQGEELAQKLRRQRDGESNPERRAVLSAQLSDALVQRGQHQRALSELEEALRQFPNQPGLRVREAMLSFGLGQHARAAEALAAARRLGASGEMVERAATLIEGGPQTQR